MREVEKNVIECSKTICSNIDELYKINHGLLAKNVLSQLRNLLEAIMLFEYSNKQDSEVNYENIQKSIKYMKTRGEFKDFNKFHQLLQKSVSHYTENEENSERLVLKYFEYLLKLKKYMKKKYSIKILDNIGLLKSNDEQFSDYYKLIAEKIESDNNEIILENRYYIQKIKPFFINEEIYYEVTFSEARDNANKFDRVIAFTKLDILDNYAVKLKLSRNDVTVFGSEMPIYIIKDYEVSIRPCEINNFAKIFGIPINVQTTNKEYSSLMKLLKGTHLTLVDLLDLDLQTYNNYKQEVTKEISKSSIFKVLDECRILNDNKERGMNIIRYLLFRLNNTIIKKQYYSSKCDMISSLYLSFGCIPFDDMPFCTSLINHNPRYWDLFFSIDQENRNHELLARFLQNNTEKRGKIYTPKSELVQFGDLNLLKEEYNNRLYYKHKQERKIEEFRNALYITKYEKDSVSILNDLKVMTNTGVTDYEKSVKYWLKDSTTSVDCKEKEGIIKTLFSNSTVALIYGSAGTGKSTLISHVSNFFKDKNKLCLANTNPAVDNLKRRVNNESCTFSTISSFLNSDNNSNYTILIIDECSTVSNDDMKKVLAKAKFSLLLLVGDIYQIQSIRFGNWFSLAKEYIRQECIYELTKPYRTANESLLELWNKVRDIKPDILEHIVKNNYSSTLNSRIFEVTEDDEIIQCLNYDGLYGINNINRFMQKNNSEVAQEWGANEYKVNDPILFTKTKKFSKVLYNNLKGKIVKITKFDNRICFDILIDKVLNELDIEGIDLKLRKSDIYNKSIISLTVKKTKSTDEESDSEDTIVPFQVAYAVSIHKAQGLEYKSVKIVISDEIDEKISHNIFYTAITRAKKTLTIFWSKGAEHSILSKLEKIESKKDYNFIRDRLVK